jgi:hypothetical protein
MHSGLLLFHWFHQRLRRFKFFSAQAVALTPFRPAAVGQALTCSPYSTKPVASHFSTGLQPRPSTISSDARNFSSDLNNIFKNDTLKGDFQGIKNALENYQALYPDATNGEFDMQDYRIIVAGITYTIALAKAS